MWSESLFGDRICYEKAQLDFNGCSDVGSSKYSTAVDLNLDLNSNAYSCLLTVQLYTWPYTAVLSQLVRSRMFKKEVTRMVSSLLLTMLLTTAVAHLNPDS